MAIDKSSLTGNTTMLILKLLEERDMYGYQMIEELARRSDNTFALKAGTLYPLLHHLEQQGMLSSYESSADSAKVRKYYCISCQGRRLLAAKKSEWQTYAAAVNQVLQGGVSLGTAY